MKYFLILWATVFSALCLFAAHPRPPAGYAYETDLRPHSLVLTNATAAGLATRSDITSATNALKSDLSSALKPTAIYTPDGQTWTDATGCVWRIDSADCWRVEIEDGVPVNAVLYPVKNSLWENKPGEKSRGLDEYNGDWRCFFADDAEWGTGTSFFIFGAGADATVLESASPVCRYVRISMPITNLVTRVAYTNELANLTTTIPQTVTNVVRDVQGLVYDEKLCITWKQIMYDGNLYYVAVTNANITEVAQ